MAYRNPRWKTLPRLAIILGVLATPGTANADDNEDLAGLLDEEVVSGASKTDELAKDAPATTSVITAEDIRRYGIRSISEAIDFLGMGLVTQNPLHGVEVGGRGVLLTADFGNHVLLVVDGHVFNEPWNGTAHFDQGGWHSDGAHRPHRARSRSRVGPVRRQRHDRCHQHRDEKGLELCRRSRDRRGNAVTGTRPGR